MADEKAGGLPAPNVGIDVTKIPLYGQDDERMQELNNAQQDVASALEHRYDQPNWWKVAAGFAKPQLGGFLASLGSASEAMGENLENQRASMMPVAQMKLQIAQTNMLLGANKKVADQIKAWRDANPGMTPTAQQIGDWEALAPNSNVVKSLKDELSSQHTEQGLARDRTELAYKLGRQPSEADLSVLFTPTTSKSNQQTTGTTVPSNQPSQTEGENPPSAKSNSISNEDFLNATHGMENIPSGQKAKTSSAIGPGGIIDSTRQNLQKKYNLPDGYGTNPEITSQYENALLKDNAETVLKPNKLDETALNHRMAWFFGPDSAKILHSDPSSKISEVITPEAIKANGLDPNARIGKLVSRVEGNLWDQGINPENMIGNAQSSQTQEKSVELPTNPADDPNLSKKSFSEWGFAPVPQSVSFTKASADKYAKLDKEAEDRINRLEFFGAPENNQVYRANIDGLLNFASESKENGQALASVVNKMNSNPKLVNSLLHIGEDGFHAHFGDAQANFGLPVKTFLNNFQTKEEQNAAQMLVLALDNANFINGKLKGMSATANIPAAEANLLVAGQLSRDMNYGLLMKNLSQMENSLDMQKDLYQGSQKLFSTYQGQLNPIASNHQIVNSKWWKDTTDKYNKASSDLNARYNKGSSFKKNGE